MSPENAPETGSEPQETSGKDALIHGRKRPAPRKVVLPATADRAKPHVQYFAALSPLEMAEINGRTYETIPDPDRPGEVKVKQDHKRQFYMIAKAACDEKGNRMYQGPAYVLGAEQIGNFLDNAEIDLCFNAVNDHSGLSKGSREVVGKESGGTPNIS